MKRWLASAVRQIGLEAEVGRWRRRLTAVRQAVNYSRHVTINGRPIAFPHIRGVSCTFSEPWMLDLLRHLLPIQSGAFIDVGSNLGQTLVKVRALDLEREYLGFEPNPSCVSYLAELVAANHFEKVTVLPVGLYTSNRILVLESYADGLVDSSASLVPEFRPGSEVFSRQLVPAFRFDAVEEHVKGAIGIIKIDVEGAELEVLESLSTVVQRERPIIIVEVLPAYSTENVVRIDRQERIQAVFLENDYQTYRVHKTDDDHYAGLECIEGIGIHSDLRMCDYLVAPREKCAKLDEKRAFGSC